MKRYLIIFLNSQELNIPHFPDVAIAYHDNLLGISSSNELPADARLVICDRGHESLGARRGRPHQNQMRDTERSLLQERQDDQD